MFRDEDFAALYGRDNGRSSVPPSLLATALLLQAHDRVSDAEAHCRATVDLSWKVALGVEVEVRPIAQTALQHFRAQLVLPAQMREHFLHNLELARARGLLRGRSLQVALDTAPIWGRGAVKDTYNLRADGIRQLLRTLARVQDRELAAGPGPRASQDRRPALSDRYRRQPDPDPGRHLNPHRGISAFPQV